MRVLPDTNVLVAAFATRGMCEDVLRVILTRHELLLGHTVLNELQCILINKLRLPATRAQSVQKFLREQGVVITPDQPAKLPENDPDDRWIVAAALEGGADYLVTGDADLLDIAGELPVRVVTPREFWEQLR